MLSTTDCAVDSGTPIAARTTLASLLHKAVSAAWKLIVSGLESTAFIPLSTCLNECIVAPYDTSSSTASLPLPWSRKSRSKLITCLASSFCHEGISMPSSTLLSTASNISSNAAFRLLTCTLSGLAVTHHCVTACSPSCSSSSTEAFWLIVMVCVLGL